MGKTKKNPLGSRVEVVSGRTFIPTVLNSSNNLSISPIANLPRLLAMAELFQFYRFTKLRAYCMPGEVQMALGYAPGAAFDTPPTTISGIMELPLAVAHGAFKSTNTVLTVPRKELVDDGQIMWYKTIPGTPATQFEIQGNIYWVVGAGATAPNFVLEWTCELQSWNLTAQSPLFKAPKLLGDQVEKSSKDSLKESSTDAIIVGGVTYKKSTA